MAITLEQRIEALEAKVSASTRTLEELPGILPGQFGVSGAVQKIDCGNVATIKQCIDPVDLQDPVTLSYFNTNAVQVIGGTLTTILVRFKNQLGIVSDVILYEDAVSKIFWSAADNWFKITPQFNGIISVAGVQTGTAGSIYDGVQSSVISGTSYFINNNDLTAPPITRFPPNGIGQLDVSVSCEPSGSEPTCTFHVLLHSKTDGVPDDNDYLTGTIELFFGDTVLPYN